MPHDINDLTSAKRLLEVPLTLIEGLLAISAPQNRLKGIFFFGHFKLDQIAYESIANKVGRSQGTWSGLVDSDSICQLGAGHFVNTEHGIQAHRHAWKKRILFLSSYHLDEPFVFLRSCGDV